MAIKPALSLIQSQRIALTPELRQSLCLLQMPLPELIDHIRTEAVENPLLQITEPAIKQSSNTSAYDVALLSTAATVTLGDSIRQQLTTLALSDDVKEVAVYLTGDLSENGFLETTVEETATALGVTSSCVKTAIKAIQSCEPTGVGARNLTECLSLQLIDKGVREPVAKGVLDHIQLLIDGEWGRLSDHLGVTNEELRQLAALLPSLKPEPKPDHPSELRPPSPDIIVEDVRNRGLVVTLPKQYLPDLSINTSLLEQVKSDQAATEYIETQRLRAQNLIRAVRYRGETMLRIVQAIVLHQYQFFLDGADHLAPLTRAELANILSLHPSTVGRAIADKSLEHRGTLYPLCNFLSSRLKKGASGQVSAYVVQQTIRKVIDQETAPACLSDDEIVKILQADGVDIARRTVAKYRGCMNIPSSYVRRQIAAAPHVPQKTPGHRKHLKNYPK